MISGKNLTIDQLNEMINALADGDSLVIYELDSKVYRSADAIANSDLGLIKESPAQLIWARNAPVDEDKLKTLDIGTAVHCKLLEPHKFDDEFAIAPNVPKRSNAEKEIHAAFEAENKDKIILSTDDAKRIDLMSRSAMAHPTLAQLLSGGDSEVSVFWRDSETGLLCKCRPDHIIKIGGTLFCLDVKTTDDIEKFQRSIGDYGYNRQQAFYTEGLTVAFGDIPVFLFGVVSKSVSCGRYPVTIKSLDAEDVDAGENEFRALLRVYAECKKTGIYSGISEIGRTTYARKADVYANQNQ